MQTPEIFAAIFSARLLAMQFHHSATETELRTIVNHYFISGKAAFGDEL